MAAGQIRRSGVLGEGGWLNSNIIALWAPSRFFSGTSEGLAILLFQRPAGGGMRGCIRGLGLPKPKAQRPLLPQPHATRFATCRTGSGLDASSVLIRIRNRSLMHAEGDRAVLDLKIFAPVRW